MKKFRILDYVFEGQPDFIFYGPNKCIGAVVPIDTPMNVVYQLQNAESMDILDPRTGEVIGTHRLIGWRNLERVYSKGHSGYAITWFTINQDPVIKMQEQIEEPETENKALTEENTTLTEAILELADIIGAEGTDQ